MNFVNLGTSEKIWNEENYKHTAFSLERKCCRINKQLLLTRLPGSSSSTSSFWFSSIFRKLLTSTLGKNKKQTDLVTRWFLTSAIMFMFFLFFFGLKDSIWLHLSFVAQCSRAVCKAQKLNERFLLGWEWPSETSSQVRFKIDSLACTSLTCLRKSLSCWPATRAFRWALQAQTPFPYGASGRDRCSAWVFFQSTRPWPGCQDAVMWRAVYHVITELAVYPRLGDRGDLLERWLGSAERCEQARHERTILTLASWTQIMLLTECPAKFRWLTGIGHWSWMG